MMHGKKMKLREFDLLIIECVMGILCFMHQILHNIHNLKISTAIKPQIIDIYTPTQERPLKG